MEDIMDVEDDNWRNVKISANTILENKEYKKNYDKERIESIQQSLI